MFSINLVFVDSKTIWRLNKKYRQIDKPTTVLSFYYGDEAGLPVGEIIICPSLAKKQNFKIKDLVIHGLTNLLSQIPATKIL